MRSRVILRFTMSGSICVGRYESRILCDFVPYAPRSAVKQTYKPASTLLLNLCVLCSRKQAYLASIRVARMVASFIKPKKGSRKGR